MQTKIDLWAKYAWIFYEEQGIKYNYDYRNIDLETEKQFETTLGRYKIVYYAPATSIFGFSIEEACNFPVFVQNQIVLIYEDDVLIHEFKRLRQKEEHIIIGGDGKTRETTFYACFKQCDGDNFYFTDSYCIYNMNQEKVFEQEMVYGIPNIGMIDLNEKYFMYLSYEEHPNYTELNLIDKSKFFNIKTEKYDSGRIDIPISSNIGRHVPIKATNTGFILKKVDITCTNEEPYANYFLNDEWENFITFEECETYKFKDDDSEIEAKLKEWNKVITAHKNATSSDSQTVKST